ncbi:MAG TPA: sigma-70 family RNA polymerase sigma factor, partial [Caldisericia bacterium]|nr:sigma-70 family RNA polymerase sigma factor [Caldisericia bacterium]
MSSDKSEEKNLVERAKKGEESAFTEIVELYADKVFSEAYYIMNNREDALDASQLVFLRVFQNIKHFKGESLLSTWIYRITVNTCLRELKKRNRKPPEPDDDDPDPQDEVIRNEEEKIAMEILAKLPEPYRVILIMREMNDMPFKDISDVLGISVNLAKVRAFRAKARFTPLLEQQENGYYGFFDARPGLPICRDPSQAARVSK